MFNAVVWFVLLGALLSANRAENNVSGTEEEEEALSEETFTIDDEEDDGEPTI